MKKRREILDVLFPKVRAELLRILFDGSKEEHYVRELTQTSGLALRTVQDELKKLSAVGLVSSWSNGYQRFYRANRSHPIAASLLQIVRTSARGAGMQKPARARRR